MPVYHARNIAVRLGSMPLTETITSDIVLKKGEVAKRQSEVVEKKLLHSGYLNEKRVLFPGDRDNFELNWLGNAPFMQTQVEPGFVQPSGPYGSDYIHRTCESNRPQALTLHVKLSDEAFLTGFNGGKTHLKIEVLFNGQLSTCSLIHTNDIRSGAKSLHQTFAGYRVDFLAERPWVLLPPFTTADGGVRRFHKTRTPTERWEDINAAILKEAEERGTDKYRTPPPSAAFLHALVAMKMPECVKTMQKPGGRKFGVVDVIITAGFGNKLTTGTNYLKQPQRLKDSNYAVRADFTSDEESIMANLNDSHETIDTVFDEAALDICNNGNNAKRRDTGDNNLQRRRAPSSINALPQLLTNKTNLPTPFSSGQMTVFPPPIRPTFKNSLNSTTGSVSPRCPSSAHSRDGHKEPLPVSDRNYAHNMRWETNNVEEWGSEAFRISQQCHSPDQGPGSHALPRSCVTLPEPIGTYGTIDDLSVMRSTSVTNSMTQMEALKSAAGVGPSTPFVVPTALMLPTPAHWMSAPGTKTSRAYNPMEFLQQPRAVSFSYPPGHPSCMHSNGGTRIEPQTPPFHDYANPAQFAASVMSSPPVLYPGGPLPPTALFSVPSKPRQSCSPGRSIAAVKLAAHHSSVLISRLVIAGWNGRLVVDHAWNPPQRIFLGSGNFQRNKLSLEDTRATRLRFVSAERRMGEKRRDSIVEKAMQVPLPYLKRHQDPHNETTSNHSNIDVPDNIAPLVPLHVLATATATSKSMPPSTQTSENAAPPGPLALQRHTLLRNPVPSIQGPKAAPFLFDGPEEVLREAARMRRSRSPIKPSAMHLTPKVIPSTEPEKVVAVISSPLSSVPSSPEILADQIPQFDGSTQNTIPALAPPKPQTPSATKLVTVSQKLQTPGFATPQSSVLPKSKKRKASSQSPSKPPRSPERLMTVNNPPLNNDCVIALAESMDKKEKRGVLRQVKGERQGVFREEYVALAVRFFIAAD